MHSLFKRFLPHHREREAFKIAMGLNALLLFGLLIIVLLFHMIAPEGPVLSERNPDGTVDYWYLGGRAGY